MRLLGTVDLIITFISHHVMDGYNNDRNQWTIKTLVGEAVKCDSPEATKEKGIQKHTSNTVVAYRFMKRYLQVVEYKWGRTSG